MECVPDLAFLQMAAASNEMFNQMIWQNAAGAAAASSPSSTAQSTGSGGMKQRKTNFTSREVEALLKAVANRKSTVLFGVAGGIGWARAWHEVATAVSAVEGIHRSESDVRKKWTYLKWEAKNTSKPGRDPTSRQVLDILMSPGGSAATAGANAAHSPSSPVSLTSSVTGAASLAAAAAAAATAAAASPTASSNATAAAAAVAASNSLLEQLLVPGARPGSPVSLGGGKKTYGGGGGRISPQECAQMAPSSTSTHPSASPPSSGAPEVCLRWNSYHSNMQAVFPALLNNEQFVDVTLACEGRSIKCHKVMLSACSSYLEELLSQNPCQHPIVFMRDLKFWQLRALVEFMYSGEVNVTQDRLPSLLSAADALQIKGLAGPSSSTSSSSSSMGGGLVTDDDCAPTADEMPQQQHRRVRKRKSTNPLPYLQQMPIKQHHSSSKHSHHAASKVSSPPPSRDKHSPSKHTTHRPVSPVNNSNSTTRRSVSPPPNHHHPPENDQPLMLLKQSTKSPRHTSSKVNSGSPAREKSSPPPSQHHRPPSNTFSARRSTSPGLSSNPRSPPPIHSSSSDEPLALCKDAPLDLGMDSKDQIGQGNSYSSASSLDGDPPDSGKYDYDEDDEHSSTAQQG